MDLFTFDIGARRVCHAGRYKFSQRKLVEFRTVLPDPVISAGLVGAQAGQVDRETVRSQRRGKIGEIEFKLAFDILGATHHLGVASFDP